MRILVTGGAGYIGSHLLVELIGRGHDPLVLDDFSRAAPGALDRVAALAGRAVPVLRADIRRIGAHLPRLAAFAPEATIHLAGLKSVGESERDPRAYYDVNVAGTLALIAALEEVGCRRVVFSSSAVVYGDPDYLPIDEDHALRPGSVYGRTKLQAEQILRDWQGAHADASVVMLRYFNPVGAHPSGEIGEEPVGQPSNLVPAVAQVAAGRRARVSVFGDDYDTPDGTATRDYVHVCDLARAHLFALDHAARGPGCDVFNVGTGRGHSVLEVIDAYAAQSRRPIPYDLEPRRPGDVGRSLADPSRLRSATGWEPRHGLSEMVRSCWAWQARRAGGRR